MWFDIEKKVQKVKGLLSRSVLEYDCQKEGILHNQFQRYVSVDEAQESGSIKRPVGNRMAKTRKRYREEKNKGLLGSVMAQRDKEGATKRM